MSVRITNIQRMCFDDGPGIRTTVFLKGCSIHCPWCSNPENLSFERQACNGKEYGRSYEPEELVQILKKDQKFWGADGGVTFSGGEALMQAPGLEEVWRLLKKEQIHIAAESALFVPTDYLRIAMKYIDFFYVDVKILDPVPCKAILGGDIELYLRNVALLAENHSNIHFRVPCSEESVLKKENVRLLYDFFEQYSRYPIQIFALHNLGEKKYRDLGLEPPIVKSVSMEVLEELKGNLEKRGCQAEIIQL